MLTDWPRLDVVAAVALLAVGVGEAAWGLTVGVQPWYVVASVPVVTLPVATRRIATRLSLAVVLAGLVGQAATGSDLPGGFAESVALVLVVYAVGARLSLRASAAAGAVAVLAVVGAIALAGEMRAGNVVFAMAVLLAAWGAGRGVRLAEDRSQLLAEHRALQERGRIARELHDVVTHQVTAMVIAAGAARRELDPDGEVAGSLLDVERRGRMTLQELRRLLGVLRVDDDTPLTPQPGLSDLPRLVRECRDAGLDVHLSSHGDSLPTGDGLQLTIFRIVQESLTNAAKHLQGATVHVRLDWAPRALGVEIRSGGVPRGHSSPSSGFGLRGMAERVAAYGGELSAGPAPGGYLVRARLPLEAGP